MRTSFPLSMLTTVMLVSFKPGSHTVYGPVPLEIVRPHDWQVLSLSVTFADTEGSEALDEVG